MGAVEQTHVDFFFSIRHTSKRGAKNLDEQINTYEERGLINLDEQIRATELEPPIVAVKAVLLTWPSCAAD